MSVFLNFGELSTPEMILTLMKWKISLLLKTMPCPDPMMDVEIPSSEENLQPQGSPKKRWPPISLFSRTVDHV